MDHAEGGEPLCIVPAEEEVDVLVGVYAEKLAYDLDGKDLRVGDLWRRATLANAKILETVVYEAEDADDEGAKIHKKTPVSFGAIELGPR